MSLLNSNVESIIENEPTFKKAIECVAIINSSSYADELIAMETGVNHNDLSNPENPDDMQVAELIKANAINHIKDYFGI